MWEGLAFGEEDSVLDFLGEPEEAGWRILHRQARAQTAVPVAHLKNRAFIDLFVVFD